MPDNIRTLQESALKAEDLTNLLQHIAWEETLKPELQAERAKLDRLLVGVVLGNRAAAVASHGAKAEQLAGLIYGIDFITRLLEKILERGENARQILAQSFLDLEEERDG